MAHGEGETHTGFHAGEVPCTAAFPKKRHSHSMGNWLEMKFLQVDLHSLLMFLACHRLMILQVTVREWKFQARGL